MKDKHIHYFDYLRFIAAIGVIYMHVAAGPLRSTINANWHIMNILTSFSFTAVPLFFMMSGYLILSSGKTLDIGVLLKKRLPRLVIPLLGWTVVAILWRMFASNDFSIASFFKRLLDSLHTPAWVHFWYMYSLIVLYILSPILYGGLRSLDKKGHKMVLTIIFLLSGLTMVRAFLPNDWKPYLQVSILSDLNLLNGIIPMFLLGYYIGILRKTIPNWLLIVASTILLAVIIIGTYLLTIRDGLYNQTFQNQYSGFEVMLAVCLFLLFKQNFNKPSKFLQRVPVIPLALPIYLMHNILLSMMGYVFTTTTLWDTIFITVLNFLICFLTMKTVATIKPICFLATGMTYQDACNTCNWVYTYRKLKRAK